MAKLDLLFQAWDEAHRELMIALDNVPDGDVWRRAHDSLLSVGEIAGHIGYWEASRTVIAILGEAAFAGPLLDKRFDYYTTQVAEPVVLSFNAVELASELKRLHSASKEALQSLNPDASDLFPGPFQMTWGDCLQYMVFHVAYHTGQIYSVRHLMGHATEDN